MVRSFQLSALVLCCCSRPPQPMRDPSFPDLRLERVAIRSWSGDQLRVLTTATRLDVFREIGTPGDVVAYDAGVLLIADGTQLSAPLVTGNLFAGQFVGQGGVHLAGPQALSADTSTVAFDRALGAGGQATSDAGLVLSRPGFHLESTGFSFDVADEHATFDDAKTRFAP